MYENYMIEFSYYEDGKRKYEKDLYYGDNAQEAVDTCRAENLIQFSEQYGRIERVYKDYDGRWNVTENWE